MIDFSILMKIGEENSTFSVILANKKLNVKHIEISVDKGCDYPTVFICLKIEKKEDALLALMINMLPWVFGVEVEYDQDE